MHLLLTIKQKLRVLAEIKELRVLMTDPQWDLDADVHQDMEAPTNGYPPPSPIEEDEIPF